MNTQWYYKTLYNCPVKEAPYFWEPENLNKQKKYPFIQNDLDNTKKKNIYIAEPNINIHKNSLLPICIIEELYRKYPNSFNK